MLASVSGLGGTAGPRVKMAAAYIHCTTCAGKGKQSWLYERHRATQPKCRYCGTEWPPKHTQADAPSWPKNKRRKKDKEAAVGQQPNQESETPSSQGPASDPKALSYWLDPDKHPSLTRVCADPKKHTDLSANLWLHHAKIKPTGTSIDDCLVVMEKEAAKGLRARGWKGLDQYGCSAAVACRVQAMKDSRPSKSGLRGLRFTARWIIRMRRHMYSPVAML